MTPGPSPSSMMSQIAGAPKTFRKPSPAPKIQNCIHVTPGAVWCSECASVYRQQARRDYDRALSESKRGDVIRAAKANLVRALNEFALSPAGMKEMEAEYIKLAAEGKMGKANFIRSQMNQYAKKASIRNQQARKDELARKARMNTLSACPKKYMAPPVGADGKFTIKNCKFTLTHHARERMIQRNIPEFMISEGMNSFQDIIPQGSGGWAVVSVNGLKICGFFEKYDAEYLYVVTTVFRPGIDKPEADEV